MNKQIKPYYPIYYNDYECLLQYSPEYLSFSSNGSITSSENDFESTFSTNNTIIDLNLNSNSKLNYEQKDNSCCCNII